MPKVLNNVNERRYSAARLKALKTIGEAVRNITVTEGIDNALDAEDFVENHLKKQISITKTCKNYELRSCGIETTSNAIMTLTEPHTKISMPKKIADLTSGISNGEFIDANSTSYGFVLGNGYSINLFYNPSCVSDSNLNHNGQDRVCVNAIYDINGLARPNEVGKDIGFVTIIYPDEKVLAYAPNVYKQNAQNTDFNNSSQSCINLKDDLSVPNKDELLSMYYNGNLLGITSGPYWSASEATESQGWHQHFSHGSRSKVPKSLLYPVRCIKR